MMVPLTRLEIFGVPSRVQPLQLFAIVPTMSYLGISDIIFPSQATQPLSSILGDIKRANFSIHNRLRSISSDAEFVDQVNSFLARPLVANERCGSWYVRPGNKAAGAYFKSTDGHAGIWQFSTRRLNLHLLPLIEANDGQVHSLHAARPDYKLVALNPDSFTAWSSWTRRGLEKV